MWPLSGLGRAGGRGHVASHMVLDIALHGPVCLWDRGQQGRDDVWWMGQGVMEAREADRQAGVGKGMGFWWGRLFFFVVLRGAHLLTN